MRHGVKKGYIALSLLPYFLGKAGAGILSEQMTTRYFDATMTVFPNHEIAWLWIGGIAAISPIGLIVFRGLFTRREKEAIPKRKPMQRSQSRRPQMNKSR